MRADLGSFNFPVNLIRLLRVGSCIIPSVREENDAEQSDEVQARIRENAKYLDRKQDLTATREVGFTKIWARDAGIFLPVFREFEKSCDLVAPGNKPSESPVVSLVLSRLPLCFFRFFPSSSSYRSIRHPCTKLYSDDHFIKTGDTLAVSYS